jgi:hypothetical protein
MPKSTAALILALAALTAACSEAEQKAPAAPDAPAAPAAPVPPVNEGPLTAARAIALFEGLPTACKPIASLKFQMNQCDLKRGQGKTDAELTTELLTLRGEWAALSPDQVITQCTETFAALERTPMPRECWGM